MAHQITYRPHVVAALLTGRAAPPATTADVFAAEQEITKLHLQTFYELQRTIGELVACTQQIQNDQQYRYGAVLSEDMVKQVLRHLFSASDDHADHLRSEIRKRYRT